MSTQLNQRQVKGSPTFNNLKAEIEDVSTKVAKIDNIEVELETSAESISVLQQSVNRLNSNVGYFVGQVETADDLASVTAPLDSQAFVKAENKYVRWTGVEWVDITAADGGGGEVSSELEARLRKLENQTNTVLSTFQEDFITKNKVDYDKTNATLGTGYVRTAKLASFTDNFASVNNIDVNMSNNIIADTLARSVKIKDLTTKGGVLTSTAMDTTGTDQITLDASVSHQSTMAFDSAALAIGLPSGGASGNTYLGDKWVGQDFAGRWWTIWVAYSTVASVNGIWFKVEDANGNVIQAEKYIPAATVGLVANAVIGMQSYRITVNFDANNNAMFVWPVTYVTNYYTIPVMIDGTTFNYVPPSSSSTWTSGSGLPSSGFRNCNGAMFQDNSGRYVVIHCYSNSNATYVSTQVYNSNRAYLGGTSAAITGRSNTSHTFYDKNRDRFVTFAVIGGSKNIMISVYDSNNYSAMSVIKSVAITQSDYNLEGYSASFVYDASTDQYLFAGTNLNSELIHVKITPGTYVIAAAKTIATGVGTGAAATGMSYMLKDGDNYHLIMSKDSVGDHVYYCLDVNGNIITPETAVQQEAGGGSGEHLPFLYKNRSGQLVLLYSNTLSYYPVYQRVYTLQYTMVTPYVSNDNGVNWYPVTLGTPYTFSAMGNKVRVRFVFASPIGTITSTLNSYSFIEGSSLPGAELTKSFVSSTLPLAPTTSKISLSAVQLLNEGSIDWAISTDGGSTWVNILLGAEVGLASAVNPDIRVKATLKLPVDKTISPIIKGYTVNGYSFINHIDVTELQTNLMRTNFKLAAYQNATRYAMQNMLIDTFTDATGIDPVKSDAKMSVLGGKLVAGGIVNMSGGTGGGTAQSSYTTPQGWVVTSDKTSYPSSGIYSMSNLFDGLTWGTGETNYWLSNGGTVGGIPLTFDFGAGIVVDKIEVYGMAGSNRYLNAHVEISADGTTWTRIGSFTGAGKTVTQFDTISIGAAIKKMRFIAIAYGEYGYALGEIKLYQIASLATFVTAAETTLTSPKGVLLITEELSNGGGSISYQVSCNDGVTWEPIIPGAYTLLNHTGTKLRLKGEMKNGAFLLGYGLSWQ